MRLFIILFTFFGLSLKAETIIYTSTDFVLQLREDSSFIFYPIEMSLKTNVSGKYLARNDSLILTTHYIKPESAVFAIYKYGDLQLKLLHFQKEFALSLPTTFILEKTLYSANHVKQEYHWTNRKQGDYLLYSFSQEGFLLAIENYQGYRKEGMQRYYFNNPYMALESELHYKEGLLHGSAYYFEAIDNKYLQVQLLKEEKYKEGKLIKTKTPATPPIFYTSHF